jgi:murein DD-endopeptidase MepM/ murein hydrolase activator NlpD
MRKAFLRTPVNFTRISSRFSTGRKHPILNTIRAHKGVDYAAPKGTPVKAAGDGKVVFKGRKGGYGRVIILQHGAVYSTLYGHLNAFNHNIKVGSRVKQGQIIGYVGMSGLATGPHLHYEFRVNGVHRNPLTVKLPDAEPLPKQYMADFNNQSQPLLTQLDLYRRTTIADAGGMSDNN